jgi:hypothetical protein
MSQSTNKLQSDLAVRTYAHDLADGTVVTKLAYVAMTELFMALATVVVGAFVTFKIFAATDSLGTGVTVVKAHATPTTADAVGDQLVLEVSADEVKAALEGATHVCVEVDMASAGDIAAVTYVRSGFRQGQANQTADVIA